MVRHFAVSALAMNVWPLYVPCASMEAAGRKPLGRFAAVGDKDGRMPIRHAEHMCERRSIVTVCAVYPPLQPNGLPVDGSATMR